MYIFKVNKKFNIKKKNNRYGRIDTRIKVLRDLFKHKKISIFTIPLDFCDCDFISFRWPLVFFAELLFSLPFI